MKMKTLGSVIVLFVATAALAQSTFHGNIARTGVYDTPGPKQLGGVKWKFTAGGPIVTSPAIADGVVYIGAMDGHLYAIDEQTGKEKWNFKSRMPIASSPAVSNGSLYFVSSAGSLAALDIATGKLKPSPTPMTCSHLRRPSRMARSPLAVETATSTPSTRKPACCSGSFPPKTWCTPHQRW
jgi:hypothetical protein